MLRPQLLMHLLDPGRTASDPMALARQLERTVVASCAAWPSVHQAPSIFVRFLADRLPPDEDICAALGALRATDLYLACACSRQDPRAIEAFEGAFFGDVAIALRKMARTPDFIDETRQRLRTKLFVSEGGAWPRIAEYKGRGDLRGWFRMIFIREAL